MRILIISVFFPPLNSIASHRPYSWAKYWTLEGHDVTVLTIPKVECGSNLCLPNPGFKVMEVEMPGIVSSLKAGYREAQGQTKINPIKNFFMKGYHYLRHERGIFNACRMPDFTDLWINPATKAIVKEGKWDLVVSTSGPYAVHFIANQMKKRGLAKKWIADFRDLWTDNHAFPGVFPFNLVEGFVEKKILQNADRLTIVSPVWADNLAIRHPLKKIDVIENGFDPDDLLALPEKKFFPADGKFRLVHTGKIYPGKQALELLFEALERFRDRKDIEVIFVGLDLEYIDKLIKKHHLEEIVKSTGLVPRQDCLAMQRDADALLFFPWNDPTGTGIGLMSGKIYEYLFSQTPILAIGGQGGQSAQKLLSEANAGKIMKHKDEIAQFISERLATPPVEKNKISKNFLEQYTRKHQALKLLNLLWGSAPNPDKGACPFIIP